MTNVPEQLVSGMRFTAVRMLSRGILKEIRKAGACAEPHCSLGLWYLPAALS